MSGCEQQVCQFVCDKQKVMVGMLASDCKEIP
jgi:hypothetical protein